MLALCTKRAKPFLARTHCITRLLRYTQAHIEDNCIYPLQKSYCKTGFQQLKWIGLLWCRQQINQQKTKQCLHIDLYTQHPQQWFNQVSLLHDLSNLNMLQLIFSGWILRRLRAFHSRPQPKVRKQSQERSKDSAYQMLFIGEEVLMYCATTD